MISTLKSKRLRPIQIVTAGILTALMIAGGLGPLAVLPVLGMVGITALEILVSCVQAYIFAILTCIYLNDALHQHH